VPAIGIVIIWYGGELVLQGKLKVGDLVMFETYSLMLLGPITQMIDSLQNLQQNLGSLDRVCDVLNQSPDMPDRENAIAVAQPRGHIKLCDISFGYKPDQTVIDHITLDIPAGSTLAVVGPSGSGKTTLVNLIARFYDVASGAILLDGVDIKDIRLADYRRQFAMVLQDVYLFDGTIMENIGFGRRNANEADIIDAAKKANAHEFIMAMDKGYQTPVGERGNKLSGGQKQRISIARAILADPRILVLDEATSSLDTQSEKLIQQSLNDLMRNRTTIVIAHRLSTIMDADSIAVLVEGKIVEQGSHEQLLDNHGIYHMMFTQQFERHRDPALERIEWEKVL
jgi:ABC-type multidrug transport system fused ATPase/permease subunit